VVAITHGLLNFSQQREAQELSLASLAERVAAVLRPAREVARRRGIGLSCDIPADLPAVSCHEGQVAQVIMALLTNAMEALEEDHSGHDGEKEIVVTAREMSLAADRRLRAIRLDLRRQRPRHF